MTVEFDEHSHTYTVDGSPLPSVTQVIAPLYDWSWATGKKREALDAKAKLGTAVHKACELRVLGTLDEETIDPPLVPYLEAFDTFLAHKKPELIATEDRMYHPQLRYAGTMDHPCVVDDLPMLIDWKTCVAHYKPVPVQLAAYAELRRANGDIRTYTRASLLLKPNGTYDLKTYRDPLDWSAFLAMLTIYNWSQRNAR